MKGRPKTKCDISNPCITHKNGKYKKWPCNTDIKNESSRLAQLAKIDCKNCGYKISPQSKSKYCKKCYNKFVPSKLLGKKLPKWWCKRISTGQGVGENNKHWKGENAGYWTKHKWIVKEYGNPSKCEDCGVVGKKNIGGRWTIQWANISGEYKRIVSDYKGLCVSCHIKFDGLIKTIDDYQHGQVGRYRRGCKCELCKKAKSMHRKGIIKYSDTITK